jgi:hypothetical protein
MNDSLIIFLLKLKINERNKKIIKKKFNKKNSTPQTSICE